MAQAYAKGEELPTTSTLTTTETIKQTIIDEFSELGEKAVEWATRVAHCESTYNPNAKNPIQVCSAKHGCENAQGLFQYLPSTYYANGGTDLYDWKEQIEITKDMYSRNQQWQWECK